MVTLQCVDVEREIMDAVEKGEREFAIKPFSNGEDKRNWITRIFSPEIHVRDANEYVSMLSCPLSSLLMEYDDNGEYVGGIVKVWESNKKRRYMGGIEAIKPFMREDMASQCFRVKMRDD